MSINLFRDQVVLRRAAERSMRQHQLKALAAPDYDQKPWGLMYKAMTDNLGVSPKNFQLVYPFISWDWATQNVGFIGADQYDFTSTVPQWSAVGQYASSGDRFNQAYQQFLNIIVPATTDPKLKQEIEKAQNDLTAASNQYTSVYMQAQSVYADDPSVQDNTPTFTQWLASPAGKGWATQLEAADKNMVQAQKNYDALVAQANTPGLEDAQAQFANESFYAKLNGPGLSGFPMVPNWSISQTSSEWVQKIQAGDGPAGGTFGFTNRDSSYDYSNTWAKGSFAINEFFWSVKANGKWQRIDEFESDQSLEVSVQMEAMDVISIQPSDWYNGPFVRSMGNGQFFQRGYSPYGGDGTQAVFGEKGFLNLLKTGMYVCYKPSFTITTSQRTFESFRETFEASTGLRIGPFRFEASGGVDKAGWKASAQGQSFTGRSTSETPLIFGITIDQLPDDQ